MANNQIKLGVGFNVDKTGLNQIRAELQQIKNMTQGEFLKLNTKGTTSDLFAARRAAEELDDALNKAFNKELGTLNVAKFNQALKASDKTIDQLYADLSKCGTKGQQAFRNIATEALTTNRQLKQTHNLIDKMAETMGNTIKWGVASSVMNSFTGSVQKAYGYVKNLDSSLNDIRIVTGKSVEDMDKFAERASKASKALAASTTDYTEAALIYYQQGLADKEVQTRAETTLKAANVTGQSGREVSEQLTAVWNGYKVSAQETELYVDKLAAVAATTASDLEELSTGMSKVASAASSMGVDIDQLNGHLSTVISVTRQAPESVGTAFKTIYARLGDLAVDGEDEFGVKLGEVSGKLKQMGIEILDSQGQMRDMGTVMEEVAEKWNGWTDAQKQAAAVAMAGKRQYNNLIALFDNWDMYTEAVNTSANAMGTLQNQQNIYMDSTEAHLDIMRTSFEDLYDSLLSGDDIETFADAITKVVNGLTTFVDSISGGANTLMLLGSVGTQVFSKQIAQGIGTTISNLQAAKYNATQVQAEFELLEQFKGVPMADKALKDLVKWKGELLGFGKLVSTEQQNEANSIMKTRNELELQVEAWKENEQALDKYLKKVGQKTGIENVKRTPGGGTTEEYDKAYASIEKLMNRVKGMKGTYAEADAALKKYQASNKEGAAVSTEFEGAIDKVVASMDDIKKKGLAADGQMDELSQALHRFKTMSKIDQKNFGFEELMTTYKKVFNGMEAEGKEAFDLLEKEANGWSSALEREIAECEQRWNNFTKNLKTVQATQQIINLVSGIGSLATAIQSLMNIKDIINNEDLSAGEKAIQIITALSTALTIGSLGVSTLSGSFVKLTTILGVYAATEGIAEEATEELTKEIVKQNAVTKTHTVTLGKYTASANTLGGAIKGLLGQQVKLPGALAKVASKFGIASSGAISLGAALGIVAAAIGAVTVSAIALHKWWTKDARAAEEAADAAQKASEAANSVKEIHQGIIDTLNKYDTAVEKMNSVTKGTEEWNTALQEANSSVLELLNTFPELASGEGYFEKINGQLKLTEEGLDYIKEKSESMLTSTTAAANIANVESQKANINSDITNLSREIKVSKSVENYNAATGSSTTSYATTTGLDKEVIEKAIAAIQENGNAFLSNTSTIMEVVKVESNVANALKDNSTELIRLANSLDAIEISEDLVYEQTAASALQDNTQYQGLSGEAQGAVNQIVGDELQAEVEKLAKSTFATMTDANEEAAKQFYGAQMTREGEKEGTTDYLINGTWQTFTDDVTLMSLATQEATKGVEGLAESTLKTAKQIDALGVSDSVKGALFGFTEGKVGDLSSLDSGEIQELKDYNENNSDLLDKLGMSELGKALENEVKNRLDTILEDTDNQELIEKHSSDNLDITKLLKSEDLNNAILDMTAAGLDLESVFEQIDWSAMDSENIEGWFKNAFEKGIEKAQETAWGSEEKINLSRDSLNVLSKGDESELSEEELAHLQELEAEYEKLGAIQDRTSHEYLETLRQIKEEQEKIALENELTNFNNTAQEIENLSAEIEKMKESDADPIDIQVKTEELDALLNEIEESDYRIKVLVEADLASDVEDAFGLAEEFSNLQEMIPQSLEVTYAEAQAIIESGNGAILQNCSKTANQTIMLHEETANAYIDAKQAELEASKEQKIKELEQERALLVAQREALTGKLEALKTALTAQDAASAAAALQEAQRYDELYRAKVEELNAKLTAEGEKATEEGAINEELYNNLGGMYETDVTNQENAEETTTNTQKLNIEARIRNVQLLHSHYAALARQIAASENGKEVPTAGTGTSAEGGVSGGGYKADEAESQDIQKPKEITEEDLKKYFDEGENDKDREEFNATIQAMIDGTTAQIEGLNAQIGSIDAGIEALNSASTSLDDFQNNLGSNGNNSGSGKGKEKDPEKLDKVKLEDLDLDPYRRVNSELERIANNLEKLSNEQDRLYGKDLLDNLKKQSKELKNQVYWSKEKLKIAKDERDELKESLGKQGINFDKHGDITNADTILKEKRKNVNEDISKYNSMSAAEQESSEGKALKQQIENKKAAIEALKENIGDYEELINSTIPGLENDIQEYAYQQIEIEITKFKLEGQLYLDMSEALSQLADFKKTMNEYLTYDDLDIGYRDSGTDLALGGGSLLSEALIGVENADANVDLLLGKENKDGTRTGLGLMGTIGDGTDSPVSVLTDELTGLQSEYEKYRQDPENYRGKFAKEGEDGEWYFDEAGFREAMQETSANLEEEIAKVEEAYKENREALLQSIDLIGESYAQQMETYDFINDRIESQIEAAKLLNGETDYAGMQDYYKQASANAQAKADTAKEEMDLAYSKMNDENLSAEEREKWKKIYEESIAEYEDASFAAIEAYKAENENFVRAQADAAFGTDAEMDLADAQWEIQTALDDKYLDSIDKAYETQKLSRQLQQDMDGASLAAQKKLAKFRDEELEKLKEKDKLTQYDVDRANKLYEIELKKIALEEAQQNKSKMRLRRDSSGNYSYQFVADEDQTAEAQQGLEDAQYGLREMDLEHQRELQEKMLEMQKEYKEKWIEYQLLSEEEQKAREAEYSAYFEYYQDELTNMSAQALETQDNLKESSFEIAKTLYDEDETNFKDLTEAQKLALQDKTREFKDLTEEEKKAITEEGTGLMPTWNTAVTTMIDKFSGEGEDSFKSKITSAQTAVDTKQSELNDKINAAATGVQKAAQTAQTEAQKKWLPAQKEVNSKLKTANERLSKANQLLEKQRDWWKKIKEKAAEAIAKTQTYLALTAKEEGEKVGGKNTKGKNNTNTTTSGNNNNNKNNEKTKKEKIAKDAVEIIEKVHYGDIPQSSGGWTGNAKKAGYSQEAIDLALKAFNDSDPSKGFNYNYEIAKKLIGLKTGGYTGQGWSSKDKNQGKVALLHEKELVLNANDTANMLEMIRLTRELFAQQNGLARKTDNKSNLEQEIQEAREAYKKVWAEYNSVSATDRDAKAQEYKGLKDQLRELIRVQEEAKAASQLEYENALAQLEEQKLNVRNSIEVAKHLQDIASKQEGRLTASDIATSFEQVLSNQNKAFSNREDAKQNKIVDGLNMTIEKVMEAMNNNLQSRMNTTDQMMNTLKDAFVKEKEKSLDQTVYVNAEFPNASKVEDIEKALNNLVNRASQKANSTRKKR